MDKKTISTMKKMFDDIMHTTEDGTVEFWYARELMGCLGYTTWRRFKDAINRVIESCKSAEIEVSDHFADAVKMVEIGSKAVRDVDDILLTRYACYLIAQNGDPRKEEIAFAQSYFAVQTRKQELILNELIGSTCATALAKYAIIQLIRQGIPAYLIKDFTGYNDDIYNHCQEIVNEENGAVSKEERCKIIDAGIRMSRLSEIM